MSAAVEEHVYTEEEYLVLERAADHKSEYFAGRILRMAGASRNHNLVAGNFFGELREQFKGLPSLHERHAYLRCRVKVCIPIRTLQRSAESLNFLMTSKIPFSIPPSSSKFCRPQRRRTIEERSSSSIGHSLHYRRSCSRLRTMFWWNTTSVRRLHGSSLTTTRSAT